MKVEALLPLGKLDPGLRAPDKSLNLSEVGQDAMLAENLGYNAVLMEETKDDPFQVLAMAAMTTNQIQVGTSVAIAFARSPFVIAQAAWTLQKLSKGRFELGLGSQVRGHIQRRFGLTWHPAGPWMRDYVRAVRAIWHSWQSGTPIEFESRHYNLNLSVPLFTPDAIDHPDIRIQVAAVNPYMCRVAAEVADGVRLHPVCSPRYISEIVVPAIEDYRSANFEICLKPLIVTATSDEKLQQRIEIARARLAFYCATPAYRHAFELYGLEALCGELAAASKKQAWNEMATLIDDDILSTFVVIAPAQTLADKIIARYGGLIDRIEVSMPLECDADREILSRIVSDLQAYQPGPAKRL